MDLSLINGTTSACDDHPYNTCPSIVNLWPSRAQRRPTGWYRVRSRTPAGTLGGYPSRARPSSDGNPDDPPLIHPPEVAKVEFIVLMFRPTVSSAVAASPKDAASRIERESVNSNLRRNAQQIGLWHILDLTNAGGVFAGEPATVWPSIDR